MRVNYVKHLMGGANTGHNEVDYLWLLNMFEINYLFAARQQKIVIEPQEIGCYYFRHCFAGRGLFI